MDIDWQLAGRIAGPIALLVLGAFIKRWFERRPVLISYYAHTSSVMFTPREEGRRPFPIHTHAIVLKNDGGLAATNVRLRHRALPDFPDFTIWPPIEHRVEMLPDGSRDIVIPQILSKEQLTITYLYFPPLLWNEINAGIRSDQGFARPIPAVMQRWLPPWLIFVLRFILVVGIATIIYFVWLAGSAAWRCLSS